MRAAERQRFLQQEREVLRRFMNRYAEEDFSLPAGAAVGYQREYRCACGFRTADPGAIFDHTTNCPRHGTC